jgi:predicted MFS family arabinose efflux permease
VALLLFAVLPTDKATASVTYGAMVTSLWTLLRDEPVLRRRAAYQACCMAAFGSFWTAIALRLAAPPFDLTQTGIALFALAGAGGAIVSPLAGRAGDRGWTAAATRTAHAVTAGALVLAGIAGAGWLGFQPANYPITALALISVAAFVLDLGVIGDQTLGRREINMLRPEARGRINGLFTGLFFFGSAGGSALSGVAWTVSGWSGVCLLGLLFAAAAFVMSLRERTASTSKATCVAQTSC